MGDADLARRPEDLSQYHNRIDIIRDTAKQVQKDFEIHGEDIFFSGNPETAYAELYGQLQTIISGLIDENKHKLLSLLYNIDINESIAVEAASEESPSEAITQLILDRELQKVLTRHYFSRE